MTQATPDRVLQAEMTVDSQFWKGHRVAILAAVGEALSEQLKRRVQVVETASVSGSGVVPTQSSNSSEPSDG